MSQPVSRFSIWRYQKLIAPYLFVSPFCILFIVFLAYPLASSLRLSLYQTFGIDDRIYVGLWNFSRVISDPRFWSALWHTVYYALGTLFVQLPLALALALVLNSKRVRAKNLFRLTFFAPVLVSGVLIAIVFYIIYDRRYGLLNYALSFVGIKGEIRWLEDERLAMPSIILTGVWRWTGFNMVYFLAGLQNIREDLYEAAVVDGANKFQSFLHVTLPGLRPVILFVVVMSMIGSFQLFDLPWIMTKGGPADSTTTIVLYLYENGFQYMRLGYAAAIGWALMAILFVLTLVQLRFIGGREEIS